MWRAECTRSGTDATVSHRRDRATRRASARHATRSPARAPLPFGSRAPGSSPFPRRPAPRGSGVRHSLPHAWCHSETHPTTGADPRRGSGRQRAALAAPGCEPAPQAPGSCPVPRAAGRQKRAGAGGLRPSRLAHSVRCRLLPRDRDKSLKDSQLSFRRSKSDRRSPILVMSPLINSNQPCPCQTCSRVPCSDRRPQTLGPRPGRLQAVPATATSYPVDARRPRPARSPQPGHQRAFR